MENANYAQFLDIYDYVKSLEFYPEEETFIRLEIWHAFNDRVREGEKIFLKEGDSELWKENCEKLINLLDSTDLNQKLMVGELYRNLGNFNKCMEIVKTLPEGHDLYKNIFIEKCLKKDRSVFEIELD